MRELLLILLCFFLVLAHLPAEAADEPRCLSEQALAWHDRVLDECWSAGVQAGKGLTDDQADELKAAYWRCLTDNGVAL